MFAGLLIRGKVAQVVHHQDADHDQAGEDEHADHTRFDLSGPEQAGLGDAQRPMAASGIGAALVVENIVRQVAADLEQQGNRQRRQCRQRAKDLLMQGQGATGHHAGRSSREGARADGQPPDLEPIWMGIFRIHSQTDQVNI